MLAAAVCVFNFLINLRLKQINLPTFVYTFSSALRLLLTNLCMIFFS